MNKIRATRMLRSLDGVKRTAERANQEGKRELLQSDVDSLAVAVVELAHIVKEIVYELEKEEK